MKSIMINREHRTARVEPGVRASDLNTATGPHGLAAVLGCHPAVGVAGLTVGGGLGWLLGRFGAACDNLVSADVISADGKLMHASAGENVDLFWALRGGGGNFGIVTSLEYQLHPVDQVLGGLIAFRGDVASFLRFYRDFMKAAPDALAVTLGIPAGTPVYVFERLRYADAEPLALMRNHVPAHLLRLAAAALESHGLYNLFRANGIGMRIAKQAIGARAATAAEARALGERRGAPLLTMERSAYDDQGRAVEHGHHVYRASRYSFDLTLTAF